MPSSLWRACRKCTQTLSQRVHPDNHHRTCDFADQISVLVGRSEQLFIVHRELICAKSKFFKAACSKRWLEGKEKQVKLPDVDPPVFQSYLSWVYSTTLNIAALTDQDTDKTVSENSRVVAKYVELYLLGDVLDDVRLRNKVLQTLVLDTETMPRLETVQRVWKKTPHNSPIRRMIVECAAWRVNRPYLQSKLTEYPEDFVQRVAAILLCEVPIKSQTLFTARLPAYLEPVGNVG